MNEDNSAGPNLFKGDVHITSGDLLLTNGQVLINGVAISGLIKMLQQEIIALNDRITQIQQTSNHAEEMATQAISKLKSSKT